MPAYYKGKRIAPVKVIELGGEYNLESIILEDGTQKVVATQVGEKTDGEYLCRVVDYDGTILKEQWLNTGDVFTMPAIPNKHSKLVFQEWAGPVDIIDNSVVVGETDLIFGPIYTTKSGLNEFDIEITKPMEPNIITNGYTITFNMPGTKDWGDGVIDTEITHTYYNYGKYTITCDGDTIDTQAGKYLFGDDVHTNLLLEARIIASEIGSYAFNSYRNFKKVSLANTVSKIGSNAFRYTYDLCGIIIPNNTTFNNNLLEYSEIEFAVSRNNSYGQYNGCKRLKELVVNLTSANLLTTGCSGLKRLSINKTGRHTIGQSTFRGLDKLTKLKFLANIYDIPGNALIYNYALLEYKFLNNTEVPVLGGGAFDRINPRCKIIVPDALYDEWIAATNWVEYADYIYKASEVQ